MDNTNLLGCQWCLMSLSLPKEGDVENAEQKQAREIVEACLQRSFVFKLAHGLILRGRCGG